MKKSFYLIIALAVIILAFLAWFFVGRDKTVPAGEAVRELLPFGSSEGLDQDTSNKRQETMEQGDDSAFFDDKGVPKADLFRISSEPVAGAVAFARGRETVVRYADRATGHISEAILPTASSSALFKAKVTNQTLPKVYEAHFRPDGGAVLLRFLRNDQDLVENIALSIASTTQAVNLRGEITSIAVNGNNLYYFVKDSNALVSSNFTGGAVRTVFSTPYTDWVVRPYGGTALIHTKPSIESAGYAYSINNGVLTKILGPLNALSVAPNSAGTRVVYSYSGGTGVKNMQTGVETGISPATLAEKCVWSTKEIGILFCGVPVDPIPGTAPDSWYQGKTQFSDRLWWFDTNQEIAQLLSEPKATFGLDIDAIELRLSPNEDYLIFTNKRDLSLWALKLQ